MKRHALPRGLWGLQNFPLDSETSFPKRNDMAGSPLVQLLAPILPKLDWLESEKCNQFPATCSGVGTRAPGECSPSQFQGEIVLQQIFCPVILLLTKAFSCYDPINILRSINQLFLRALPTIGGCIFLVDCCVAYTGSTKSRAFPLHS